MILPIIKPRAGGKTTILITWLKQDPTNHVIVVADEHRADLLRAQVLHALGESVTTKDVARMVVSAERIRQLNGRSRDLRFAIDDLDDVLSRLLGFGVDAFTMTGPSHDGEGRELVDQDAVYAFVNQRPAEPERQLYNDDELRYLLEDALYPASVSDPEHGKAAQRLLSLLDNLQRGVQERPAPIGQNGEIRKSDEVVTFSNGVQMPLDMVLMLGHMNMAKPKIVACKFCTENIESICGHWVHCNSQEQRCEDDMQTTLATPPAGYPDLSKD